MCCVYSGKFNADPVEAQHTEHTNKLPALTAGRCMRTARAVQAQHAGLPLVHATPPVWELGIRRGIALGIGGGQPASGPLLLPAQPQHLRRAAVALHGAEERCVRNEHRAGVARALE